MNHISQTLFFYGVHLQRSVPEMKQKCLIPFLVPVGPKVPTFRDGQNGYEGRAFALPGGAGTVYDS